MSTDGVGINVGTTLTAGVGLGVLGGSVALRLQGPADNLVICYLDGSRNSYYDDANNTMMFISSGATEAHILAKAHTGSSTVEHLIEISSSATTLTTN